MKTSDKMLAKRTVMMVAGIAFISLCVGSYRLSGFGVDAFTCMNLGISGFLDMQFGTWQLIMNAAILAAKILAVSDEELLNKLKDYTTEMKETVQAKAAKLDEIGYQAYLDQR